MFDEDGDGPERAAILEPVTSHPTAHSMTGARTLDRALPRALTLLLLIGAPVVRLIWLDSLEPNVLPGRGGSPQPALQGAGGSRAGTLRSFLGRQSSLLAVPRAALPATDGADLLALRLSVVLGSLLALGLFYLTARDSLGQFASLSATALFAFSNWLIFFSRNGEVNVWVLVYLLAAAHCVNLALQQDRQRYWVLAGIACGLGWYSYLGGVFILPIMLLYLALTWLTQPGQRVRCLRGAFVLVAATTLLVLPRVPILIQKWSAVELYVGGRSVTKGLPLSQVPVTLLTQVWTSLRVFVLMDSSFVGNARYLQPGRPIFDLLTAALYLCGLVLGLRYAGRTLLWWCMLLPGILVIQPLTVGIPDGARALIALPGMMLFAGFAVEQLSKLPRLGQLASLGVTTRHRRRGLDQLVGLRGLAAPAGKCRGPPASRRAGRLRRLAARPGSGRAGGATDVQRVGVDCQARHCPAAAAGRPGSAVCTGHSGQPAEARPSGGPG